MRDGNMHRARYYLSLNYIAASEGAGNLTGCVKCRPKVSKWLVESGRIPK